MGGEGGTMQQQSCETYRTHDCRCYRIVVEETSTYNTRLVVFGRRGIPP